MELSRHIQIEAENAVRTGETLPKQLTTFPELYVAERRDETILAFGAFECDGAIYKIGVKMESMR